METINKNRIIAEFMGFEYYKDECFELYISETFSPLEYGLGASEMKFNSDWNWLMLVAEKIDCLERNTDDDVFIEKISKVTSLPLFTPIHTFYNNCIEFIKWYNEQKN